MKNFLYLIHIFFISLIKINFSYQTCYEYSCEECSSSEYGKCTKCHETFRLLDGKCLCSFSSCSLCTSGLAGLRLCYICREGYIHQDDECICPVDNCEICEVNGCKKCSSGYYYNSTLNECLIQNEEDKIICNDTNCDICFSKEKGACIYCKDGYYEKKGECYELDLPINNTCPITHFLEGNYCHKKCYGINCNIVRITIEGKLVNFCKSNHCLVCIDNYLKIISECDNSEECSLIEGCLNCIDNEECLICMQGYFLINGICKKCVEGCSICTNQQTCEYCLSGYKLTNDKLCNFTNNFDFNETSYKEIKNELVNENFPEENINKTTILTTIPNIITAIPTTIIKTEIIKVKETQIQTILECDENCLRCNKKTGICSICKDSYYLINNKCIIKNIEPNNNLNEKTKSSLLSTSYIINEEQNYENHHQEKTNSPNIEIICNIENCLKCSMSENKIICSKCTQNYYLENNICKKKCKDKNCNDCSEDVKYCNKCNENTKLYEGQCAIKCSNIHKNCIYCLQEKKCIECENNYKIKNNYCIKKETKTDYSLIYFIILFIVFALILIIPHRIYYTKMNNKNINQNHIRLDEQ